MNTSTALEGLYSYFDNLAEGIVILDLEGNIVSMNRTAAQLVGIPEGELPQEKIEELTEAFTPAGDLIPTRQRPSVLARHNCFLRNYEAVLRPCGTQISTSVEISTAPIPDAEGKAAQIILSYRDISDRHRTDETRSRLAAIVESSEDAIIGLDNQGTVTTWNRGAEKIFGYSAAETMGASVTRLIPMDREGEEDTILARIRRGEIVQHFETVRRRKDGCLIDVSLTVSPVRGANGEIVGASKIARDITGRRRTNDALHESQQRLTGIIESAMDAIITIDEQQRIVLFNSAAEQMFLCPQAQALGQPIDQFMPARFRANHHQHIRKFGTTGTTARAMGELGTLSALRSNGEEFPIEASISQVESGGDRLYTVILRDITDRCLAEESLREQAELLTASQMIARDMESRIVFWPEGAEKMYGFTAEEALGAISHQLFHTEFPEPIENIMAHLLTTGRWEGELIHNRSDGTSIVVSSAWILHCDKNGTPFRILESLIDVTGRRQAEELTRQSEERFARVFRSSPIAITIITTAERRYVDVNAAFVELLGYQASEVFGRTDEELGIWVHPEQHTALMEKLARDGKIRSFEAVYRAKTGQTRTVILSMDTIALDAVPCILTTSLDVTETRTLEQQFRQSQKMEALGQLTGGIAHDFNNLLGVIVGNLDLLERIVATNDVALKRVRTALRTAVRGAELTRRLLAFSRREQLNPAPIPVESALRDLADLATRTLGPEIKITTQCDGNLPPIFADAAALESALLNLSVNARDAMPKGGSLTLSAHLADVTESYALVQAGEIKSGRYARIAVSDSGCGMSRETLDRALEPFFTTKPRDKGTGLGLAMVYGFIKQSGGAIRLYSELGIGTTVSLYLPLADQTTEEALPTSTAQTAESLGGTALVVDDETDLLDIADAYLTELGYSVIRAGDAAAALAAIAQAGNIDLMVTDIIMPGGMNGIELAKKVRALRPGIRVIYTSGFPAEALAERSGRLEGGPLLHKPYLRAEFTEMVKRSVAAGV